MSRTFLFDGDGGRESVDCIYVRLFHQAEKLPGICREGFDIAPLALRVDGIEGEGGFARTGKPRDHCEAVSRDLDGDVFEVVHPRAADDQSVVLHSLST